MRLHVALFDLKPDGVQLIGRTEDSDVVELVRERIAAQRRAQLAQLEGRHLRALPSPAPDDEEGGS